MKRWHQLALWIMMGITMILSAIILFFVVFNQKVIPDLKNGINGKDAVVDYAQLEKYIDDSLTNKFQQLPPPVNGHDAAPVNYDLINAYIEAKVAALPKPTNGVNGANGTNGTSCTVAQTELGAVITCQDGTSAVITNGQDGKSPIIRCNTNKNRLEMQYAGDTNWAVVRDQTGTGTVKCVIGKE